MSLNDLATRNAETQRQINRLLKAFAVGSCRCASDAMKRQDRPQPDPTPPSEDVWEAGMLNGKAFTGTNYLTADSDE